MRSIQIHLSQIQQRACFGHQNQLTNFDPLNINAGKTIKSNTGAKCKTQFGASNLMFNIHVVWQKTNILICQYTCCLAKNKYFDPYFSRRGSEATGVGSDPPAVNTGTWLGLL